MFFQIFRRESGSANKIPSRMAFKRKQPDATHNCIFCSPLSQASSHNCSDRLCVSLRRLSSHKSKVPAQVVTNFQISADRVYHPLFFTIIYAVPSGVYCSTLDCCLYYKMSVFVISNCIDSTCSSSLSPLFRVFSLKYKKRNVLQDFPQGIHGA